MNNKKEIDENSGIMKMLSFMDHSLRMFNTSETKSNIDLFYQKIKETLQRQLEGDLQGRPIQSDEIAWGLSCLDRFYNVVKENNLELELGNEIMDEYGDVVLNLEKRIEPSIDKEER